MIKIETIYGYGHVSLYGQTCPVGTPFAVTGDDDILLAVGDTPGDGKGPYVPLLWGDTSTGYLMNYPDYTPYWDATLQVVFVRPRLETVRAPGGASATDFAIAQGGASTGPTMPSVELQMAVDVPSVPSWLDSSPSYYRFTIGKSGQGTYEILAYPDHSNGRTCRSQAIESGHIATDTFTINADSQSSGSTSGWNQTTLGVGGGTPSRITLSCQIFDEDDYPMYADVVLEPTYYKQFYIIGEQPTSIDAYIDTIEVKYYPDDQNPTGYKLMEGNARAKLGGVDVPPYDLISLYEGGTTTHVLTPSYVTGQLRLMLKKMHRQESSSRQFWYTGTGDGWASREGYPLWERQNYPTNDDCGLGLFQLSTSDLKTRETMWNWKKNVLKSCDLMLQYFKLSCDALDAHHPVVTENVFQPGLDLSGFTFTLDVMRRLNAFNRFNAVAADRYYWWNATAPSPSLTSVAPSGSLSISSTTTISYTTTETSINLQSVTHNVGSPSAAKFCDGDWVSRTGPKTSGLSSPFNWNIGSVTTAQFVPDQYNICYQLGIYTGDTRSAGGRMVDSSVTGDGGGFRPPQNRWVKFGYVDPNPNHGTQAFRDYNCDGVRDLDSADPYGAVGSAEQNSAYHGSSSRYADGCETKTGDH